MQTCLVGGAVRDELLGLPVKERDWVVVGATPGEMIERGYKPVGKDFPVFLHPETHEEYALARTERKTAPGYHGFAFNASPEVTLEEDLKRRDLTINAMARGEDGVLIDPWGGAADLENRILRHVSAAFAEDPVRILRVARLAARYAGLGFTVADETLELMQTMVGNGEVDALVPERVWAELYKALQTETPSVFFQVLRDCGALAVLFPEIERLYGVPQCREWHPEIDTGVHTMMVLDQSARLSDDPAVRFAALVHDLGKGTTDADILPSHHGHEERSADLVRDLCNRIRVPGKIRDLAVLVARFHGHYHKIGEMRPSTIVKTLHALDVHRKPERFAQFLLACEADARGRTGYEDIAPEQTALFQACFEAVTAVDVGAIVQQGFKGEQLQQQIHRQRIRAVRQVLPQVWDEDE